MHPDKAGLPTPAFGPLLCGCQWEDVMKEKAGRLDEFTKLNNELTKRRIVKWEFIRRNKDYIRDFEEMGNF